jgi:GNAT superfamily N-acetyltransferase
MAAAANHNRLEIIANEYIEFIIKKYKGVYAFSIPTQVSDTTYQYKITTPLNEEVGDIQISLKENEDIQIPTRSGSISIKTNVFHIKWIGINEAHQGKGLATALLLYAICKLYLRFPTYTHITLDDAIMGNQLSPSHIYIRLGFMPVEGLVELSNNGTRMQGVSGVDEIRRTTVKYLIGAIVPSKMPKKQGGTRKTRRYRKKQKKTRRYRR